MPEFTPESEVTLHITESGLQLALNAYQRARPEEFRVVSSHYPDGDPGTTPISLNDDGEWLDYAVRLENIVIDMAPPDGALHSPIPPQPGQFQISARIAIELRNFADAAATFNFPIELFVLCRPLLAGAGATSLVALELVDLRVRGIGPNELASFLEYVMILVIRNALKRIQLPTTFNVGDFLKVLMLDLDVKRDTIQLFGAIHRRPDDE